MNTYLILALAIGAEIFGSASLKLSNTAPWWGVGVAMGFLAAFSGLQHVVRTIPLGLANAIWAGLGIVGTSLVGRFLFGEEFTPIKGVGVALVVVGVVILGLNSTGH